MFTFLKYETIVHWMLQFFMYNKSVLARVDNGRWFSNLLDKWILKKIWMNYKSNDCFLKYQPKRTAIWPIRKQFFALYLPITWNFQLTKTILYKKPKLILATKYGKNWIFLWSFFEILIWAFRGHWAQRMFEIEIWDFDLEHFY